MATAIGAEWREYIIRDIDKSEVQVWPKDLTKYEREGLEPKIEVHYDASFAELDGTPTFGVGLGPKPDSVPEPKVGDHIWLKGAGLGGRNMGVRTTETWWEMSEEDVQREHEIWKAVYHRQQAQEFERNRASQDATYDALPEPFKRRIDRFRAEDPNFRASSEAYEMAPLSMATALAEWVKWPEFEIMLRERDARILKPEFQEFKDYHWKPEHGTADWEATPTNLIRAFNNLNSGLCGYRYPAIDEIDDGMKKLTGLTVEPDTHSGNTWGWGIAMAIALVEGRTEF